MLVTDKFRLLNQLQDQLNKEKLDHELIKLKIKSLCTLVAAEGPQDLTSKEMLDHIAQVSRVINMSHLLTLKI